MFILGTYDNVCPKYDACVFHCIGPRHNTRHDVCPSCMS